MQYCFPGMLITYFLHFAQSSIEQTNIYIFLLYSAWHVSHHLVTYEYVYHTNTNNNSKSKKTNKKQYLCNNNAQQKRGYTTHGGFTKPATRWRSEMKCHMHDIMLLDVFYICFIHVLWKYIVNAFYLKSLLMLKRYWILLETKGTFSKVRQPTTACLFIFISY